MANIKDMVLYAGADRKSFLDIQDAMVEGNRNNLVPFSAISAIGMAVMVIASFFEPSLEKNRLAYVLTSLLMAIVLVICLYPAKKRTWMVYLAEYLFIETLLLFGIDLGTFVEPNEVTVSFDILMFAVPLLFTDAPWRMILAITASIVLYIIAALATQTPTYIVYNLSNIIPYGIISLIVSTYLMSIKVSRYLLERKNKFLSESDQLTGLLNRNSYEQHIAKIKEDKDKIISIAAFDINGLKLVNDNLGHQAGDELIKGAADCISGVFNSYGHVYRTGGDEFMVIIEGLAPTSDELWSELEKRTRCWKGSLVSGLSLCMGVVTSKPGDSIEEVISKADKLMYSYKEAYYRKNDIKERRS
ncbi:MAG: GGDEF domain-containing protein [Sphaerochaetaceae bacterium]|nr:GGDEF domain-containing protein [Sphaerochaetaceae bacterium]